MKKITVRGRDGYCLDVHLFEVENPKFIVQLIHGIKAGRS